MILGTPPLPADAARADALRRVATLIEQGFPCEAVYVDEHGITILATSVSAARWASVGTLAGAPVMVTEGTPLAVTA